MAIDNINVIDGMGINEANNSLRFLITDHLPWEGDEALSEQKHLVMLQKKINAYLKYIETKQFAEKYPNIKIHMAVIEIHFRYKATDNCKKLLQTIQAQIRKYGILIEMHNAEENA